MFLDAPTKADLHAASTAFAAWTRQVPQDAPVILWLSVHGADPEPGVADDKRTLVGTSAVSSDGEEVDWVEFLEPAMHAAKPGRVVVLMDVCWGSSPTAPARLTTPATRRPHMVFGPARSALRNELDLASTNILHSIAKSGLPTPHTATVIVDSLNTKFPPSHATQTPFYRVWWWNGANGLVMHPTSSKSKVKRK